jgi:hypothetical protein
MMSPDSDRGERAISDHEAHLALGTPKQERSLPPAQMPAPHHAEFPSTKSVAGRVCLAALANPVPLPYGFRESGS